MTKIYQVKGVLNVNVCHSLCPLTYVLGKKFEKKIPFITEITRTIL